METTRNHRFDRCDRCARRAIQKKIVDDDPASSTPHGLLRWFRDHLRLLMPVNNITYTPTLPPAA